MSSRLKIVRRLLGLALVLWMLALGVSFVDRRVRRSPSTPPEELAPHGNHAAEKPVTIQRGASFSNTIWGQEDFRVAASEIVEYGSGWVEYHDAEISLFRKGQVAYGLTAELARVHMTRREAVLRGHAQLSLQGGIALRADGFVVRGTEPMIESEGPVTFAGPGWGGIAERASGSTSKDEIELEGGISVAWRNDPLGGGSALVLLAPRLRYERNRALLLFPAGLQVLRDLMSLSAPGAELQLTGSEGEIRRVSLSAPIRVEGFTPTGTRVEGEAGRTEIEALAEGRLRFAAEPLPMSGWVWLREYGPAGAREVQAWRMVGEGKRAAWEWLEGQGLTCASDFGIAGEDRRLEAPRCRLELEQGRISAAVADGGVLVDLGRRRVTGDQLEYSFAQGSFTVRAAANGRVFVAGPDLDAECERIEGTGQDSVIAIGQVSGLMKRGALMSGASATDEVRFAAERVVVRDGGEQLVLEGEARVWQADRLVRADVIEYDRKQEIVVGRGSVLTSTQLGEGRGASGRVVVRGRQFRYERARSEVQYEGDVVLEDPRARASCQRLVAILDQAGNVQRAELTGGVQVVEHGSPREIQGERATFAVKEDSFELWGAPVVVQEPSGNQVKAEHLRWLRRTNTIEVSGSQDKPSETLYHPESPVPTRSVRRRKP